MLFYRVDVTFISLIKELLIWFQGWSIFKANLSKSNLYLSGVSNKGKS